MNSKNVTLKCPSCNKLSDFRIYRKLSVTDEDHRRKIRDRSLFMFNCPHCSEVFEIDYPMYMIDKSKRQLLYLARKNQIESVENLFDRLEDSAFHKRIARTKNQFIEKIMIKDAGYDDRIIELMKVHFAKSIKKDHPDRKISEIVFSDENVPEGEIVFICEGKPYAAVKIKKELYDRFLEIYENDIESNDSYLVDFHWAYSLY